MAVFVLMMIHMWIIQMAIVSLEKRQKGIALFKFGFKW